MAFISLNARPKAGLPCLAPEERGRVRLTRGYRTGRPAAYSVLHRIGFFEPRPLPARAVGSYPTFSP